MPTIRRSSRANRIKPRAPSATTLSNTRDNCSVEASAPCSPSCSTKSRAHSRQSLTAADVMANVCMTVCSSGLTPPSRACVFVRRVHGLVGRSLGPAGNETARKQLVSRLRRSARPEFHLPDKRRKHPPAQRDRRPIGTTSRRRGARPGRRGTQSYAVSSPSTASACNARRR